LISSPPVELYDWLLFLHVLSAFVAVGAMTVLWGLLVGTRAPAPSIDPASAMTIGRRAGISVGVGMMAVLVFGIWLAIEVDGYEVWDGWILGSIVLWVIGTAAGAKAGREFERGPEGRATGIRLQAVNSVLILVILILMIWKPGA
jgi:uncharacterized membrane protein